jgi:hypothetical protein
MLAPAFARGPLLRLLAPGDDDSGTQAGKLRQFRLLPVDRSDGQIMRRGVSRLSNR